MSARLCPSRARTEAAAPAERNGRPRIYVRAGPRTSTHRWPVTGRTSIDPLNTACASVRPLSSRPSARSLSRLPASSRAAPAGPFNLFSSFFLGRSPWPRQCAGGAPDTPEKFSRGSRKRADTLAAADRAPLRVGATLSPLPRGSMSAYYARTSWGGPALTRFEARRENEPARGFARPPEAQ